MSNLEIFLMIVCVIQVIIITILLIREQNEFKNYIKNYDDLKSSNEKLRIELNQAIRKNIELRDQLLNDR